MPPPRRILRLTQLVKEIAAETIQRRLHDPRIGFVTVTRVRLAPDLTEATVYWSLIGTDAQRRTTERALTDATSFVQSEVAKAIGTRVTPTLTFRYDPSLAQAARLEQIFEGLRSERGEKGDPGETPAEGAGKPEGEEPPEDLKDDEEEGGANPAGGAPPTDHDDA